MRCSSAACGACGVRAGARACAHACGRAGARACVRACVRACRRGIGKLTSGYPQEVGIPNEFSSRAGRARGVRVAERVGWRASSLVAHRPDSSLDPDPSLKLCSKPNHDPSPKAAGATGRQTR